MLALSLAAARAPSSRAARAPARLARGGGAAAPSSACVVAVDVGTESLRAAVVDGDGRVLASASAPHETAYPAPGHAEQAPADWWAGLGAAVKSALAEAGRYREALADAELILKHSTEYSRGSALMRVRALKDFMRRMDNFEAGYHQATSTLVCLLRPREYRQLVPSTPASFGRPHTSDKIGKGLSGAASMVSLLGWDADGDGNIDMDELAEGVASLGYTLKKQGKSVFKGKGERGEI